MGKVDVIISHPEPYLYNFWNSEVLRARREIQIGFIELGRALYNIKSKRLYKYGGYKDFHEYVRSANIDIKYATSMQLIRVFQKFVVELNIAEERLKNFDYYKLDMLVPYANGSNANELLEYAERTPREILRKEIIKYNPQAQLFIKEKQHIKIKIKNNRIILFENKKQRDITNLLLKAIKEFKTKDIQLLQEWAKVYYALSNIINEL